MKMQTKFEGDEYYDLVWYLGLDNCINREEIVSEIKSLINNPNYAKDFIADYEDWVEEKRRDMEE